VEYNVKNSKAIKLEIMGRYYTGDIKGKFMFAVQDSDAGERFGAHEFESNVIHYCIQRESYDDIVKELKSIEDTGAVEKVQKMFEGRLGWNDEIAEKYGVSRKNLEDYADYEMGMKIKQWFDDNPKENYLHFEAEC
tara:strand:- start:1181 stop:1588 length:408 start_codon:yes stop_codon:yes gene_type:complete